MSGGMIGGFELADHLGAFAAVVGLVCLPGWLLGLLLPPPRGASLSAGSVGAGAFRPASGQEAWATWPALGAAYWAASLCLLPWSGGLYVAVGLPVVAAVLLSGQRLLARAPWARARQLHSAGSDRRSVRLGPSSPVRQDAAQRVAARGFALRLHHLVLAMGCLVYLTPVFLQHVPPGMDASRYVYNARLIAQQAGLPDTLAPFAPEIPFGAANHGLPAMAAAAALFGVSPVGAVLATLPLAFTALILSLYDLLRLASGRLLAAVVAVGAVWLARESQSTPAWGGFAGVYALAVAVGAARLLVDVLRRGSLGSAFLLGLVAGALPVIHGCMAAGWLYILAPVAGAVGLSSSARRRAGLKALMVAVAVAAVILVAYVLAARPGLSAEAADWIRANELRRLDGQGPVVVYMARALGRVLAFLTIAALVLLAQQGRWRGLAVLVPALVFNGCVLLAGSREWLPGALLLYPTRLREFALPAASLALVLAWRALATRCLRRPALTQVAAVGFLAVGMTYHVRYYQHSANSEPLPEEVWQAMRWAGKHLDPAADLVDTVYGTAGAYLPGVAGIAATGMHVHIADQVPAAQRMLAERVSTHVLVLEREAASALPPADFERARRRQEKLIARRCGEVVYQNGAVRLYRLVAPQAAGGQECAAERTPLDR